VPRPTFSPRKLEEIDRAYAAFIEPGFPVTFEGQSETLQARDQDKANWLYLQAKCLRAAEAGAGDFQLPEPGIRCTSNNFIRPTVNETLAILDALGTWSEAALSNYWRMKDLVRDALTNADLRAIDLTEGWP
jgi:hypothetical protein